MRLRHDDPGGRRWRPLFLAMVFGVALTVGAAIGMTATDQAVFCGSCHSMDEAALTHKLSAHAALACNECHAPHNLLAKIPFKAKEATRDVLATLTSSIPELIHPGEETRNVVQANCQRCHSATTAGVAMQSKAYCTDCHRHVPHMPKLPIAKRSAADV